MRLHRCVNIKTAIQNIQLYTYYFLGNKTFISGCPRRRTDFSTRPAAPVEMTNIGRAFVDGNAFAEWRGRRLAQGAHRLRAAVMPGAYKAARSGGLWEKGLLPGRLLREEARLWGPPRARRKGLRSAPLRLEASAEVPRMDPYGRFRLFFVRRGPKSGPLRTVTTTLEEGWTRRQCGSRPRFLDEYRNIG